MNNTRGAHQTINFSFACKQNPGANGDATSNADKLVEGFPVSGLTPLPYLGFPHTRVLAAASPTSGRLHAICLIGNDAAAQLKRRRASTRTQPQPQPNFPHFEGRRSSETSASLSGRSGGFIADGDRITVDEHGDGSNRRSAIMANHHDFNHQVWRTASSQ